MRITSGLGTTAAAASIAVILSACQLQRDITSASSSGKVGGPAPALSGETVEGKAMRIELHGQATLLVFWASWCGPCRHEQPGLNRIADELAPQGVRLIGIDFLDHDRAQAKAFQAEFGVPYPSLYDPSGKLAALYQVDYPPAQVLVDGRGVIVGRVPGEVPEAQLLKLIKEKLR